MLLNQTLTRAEAIREYKHLIKIAIITQAIAERLVFLKYKYNL